MSIWIKCPPLILFVCEKMHIFYFLLFCLSEAARCPATDFEKIRVNGEDKCVKAFIYDISNLIFNRQKTWSDSEKRGRA